MWNDTIFESIDTFSNANNNISGWYSGSYWNFDTPPVYFNERFVETFKKKSKKRPLKYTEYVDLYSIHWLTS